MCHNATPDQQTEECLWENSWQINTQRCARAYTHTLSQSKRKTAKLKQQTWRQKVINFVFICLPTYLHYKQPQKSKTNKSLMGLLVVFSSLWYISLSTMRESHVYYRWNIKLIGSNVCIRVKSGQSNYELLILYVCWLGVIALLADRPTDWWCEVIAKNSNTMAKNSNQLIKISSAKKSIS